MRAKHLKLAIRTVLSAKKTLTISGPPAVGKTKIAEAVAAQICAEQNGAWMVLHPVVDDPSDWKGLAFPSDDRLTARFLPYGNLQMMVEAKSLLICILDDVGQSDDMVQAALMQVVEERTINGIKISDFVRFILCTNRKGDKAAVKGVIEPLKSRTVIVNLEVSSDDWIHWANGAGMPPEMTAFIKLRPQLLHDFKPTSDMTNGPSPRGWEAVGRIQLADCPKEIEFELFAGAVGAQASTEYCGFLRNFREMPQPELYLADTSKAFPASESTMYALASTLAYMANKSNVAKIFELSMRMDAEYSTFMIFSMTQRDNRLAQTAGMAIWAKKYAPNLT